MTEISDRYRKSGTVHAASAILPTPRGTPRAVRRLGLARRGAHLVDGYRASHTAPLISRDASVDDDPERRGGAERPLQAALDYP